MPNKLEQAQEALAKVEAHMETLTPQTQARHMAERVRDNLAVHRHGPVQPQSRGNTHAERADRRP